MNMRLFKVVLGAVISAFTAGVVYITSTQSAWPQSVWQLDFPRICPMDIHLLVGQPNEARFFVGDDHMIQCLEQATDQLIERLPNSRVSMVRHTLRQNSPIWSIYTTRLCTQFTRDDGTIWVDPECRAAIALYRYKLATIAQVPE